MKKWINWGAFPILLILFSSMDCTQKDTTTTAPSEAIQAIASAPTLPILRGLPVNPFLRVVLYIGNGVPERHIRLLEATLNAAAVPDIQSIDVFLSKPDELPSGSPLISVAPKAGSQEIPVDLKLAPGVYNIWLSVRLKEDSRMKAPIELFCTRLVESDGKKTEVQKDGSSFIKRQGVALKKGGDDQVDTYRIPGIITTDKGTLVAVYDIRYLNSRDLPGHIDVGMQRSTDGGKTWSPMKIIMDMGPPHENNGVGDPCILFDPVTKKIWVAALWSKGNRSIAGSGPGLSPDETGQYVLCSSSDDGLTWSATYTITPQVKNPAWKLFFQGPGSGIAMKDGTLVFPSQYWDAAGIPHSNLIFSKDQGLTWKASAAAPKSNTTESQVVETYPGTLMLNMRDNRGQFRSIATTTDLGTTWAEHPTSRTALPDPVCMGSLIKTTVEVNGTKREVLLFSNPDKSAAPRERITIKASLDLGETWLPANQLLVDQRECYGYSSLTMVDDQTVGILYEGAKDIYFVKIPVREIIR
jgi:sialidase-1